MEEDGGWRKVEEVEENLLLVQKIQQLLTDSIIIILLMCLSCWIFIFVGGNGVCACVYM